MNSPGNQPVSTWIGEFILLAALWGASGPYQFAAADTLDRLAAFFASQRAGAA